MYDLLSTGTRKTLRGHQERALAQVRKSVVAGNRRVVCQMPTGAGKTVTASRLIEGALAKGNRVIFTAPAISLIDQTVTAFENEGIRDIGVMQANHPRTDSLARVQVASVQTLAKREIPEAALIIVDECHCQFDVINRLMDEREDVYFLGLSATPWAKGLGLRWQDLVIPCTIGKLIEQGYLSQFRVFAPDVPDLSKVKTVAGDYHEGQTAEVMEGKSLMASVVGTWLEKGENRPTLCFGVNRKHAQNISEQFESAGVATAYCDAFTDSVEMALIERRFRAGEIKVVCSVRKITTGVDWPVGCIIDAAPTKSEMLHVQKIGRGLRVNEGTEDLLILDHAGNSLRLGLVTDIHHAKLDATEKGKQERKPRAKKLPRECSKCAVVFSGLTCPACGHERKPISGVETVDGDLIEITGKKKPPTKAEKQAWWSGIQTIRKARGRAPGWAAHTYRDKFGMWPRGLDDACGEATPEMWNFVKSKDIRYAKRKGA